MRHPVMIKGVAAAVTLLLSPGFAYCEVKTQQITRFKPTKLDIGLQWSEAPVRLCEQPPVLSQEIEIVEVTLEREDAEWLLVKAQRKSTISVFRDDASLYEQSVRIKQVRRIPDDKRGSLQSMAEGLVESCFAGVRWRPEGVWWKTQFPPYLFDNTRGVQVPLSEIWSRTPEHEHVFPRTHGARGTLRVTLSKDDRKLQLESLFGKAPLVWDWENEGEHVYLRNHNMAKYVDRLFETLFTSQLEDAWAAAAKPGQKPSVDDPQSHEAGPEADTAEDVEAQPRPKKEKTETDNAEQ